MKVKHIKNLYWLIILISLVLAFAFSSNKFLFYTGIATSIFAFISILIGQPFILWMLGACIVIVYIPFTLPYLLLGWSCKSLCKKNSKTAYKIGACILAIIAQTVVCFLLGVGGLRLFGLIVLASLIVWGMLFEK